ncbi:hypothetical protein PENTCL1PPCAC_17557, partial [Pristionchus entomophagus]
KIPFPLLVSFHPSFILLHSSMATLTEWVVATLYAGGILLFLQYFVPFVFRIFGRRPKNDGVKLYEKKWKRDTVYLYQMPGTPTMSSVSPFCVKVESFLRLHKLNYERRYFIVGRGMNGKLPFVEFNGEHISDSQIILRRLVFHFKINEYSNEVDSNFGHAITCMADQHTYNLFLHYKVSHNQSNLFKGMMGGVIPDILIDITTPIIAPIVSAMIHRRLHDGVGRFSDEEYRELTRKDLTIYQNILADKKFLFGDKITTADCSVFGHLGAALYLDQHCHPVYLLKSHQFVPLRQYVERVRDTLFGGKFAM